MNKMQKIEAYVCNKYNIYNISIYFFLSPPTCILIRNPIQQSQNTCARTIRLRRIILNPFSPQKSPVFATFQWHIVNPNVNL